MPYLSKLISSVCRGRGTLVLISHSCFTCSLFAIPSHPPHTHTHTPCSFSYPNSLPFTLSSKKNHSGQVIRMTLPPRLDLNFKRMILKKMKMFVAVVQALKCNFITSSTCIENIRTAKYSRLQTLKTTLKAFC